MRAMLRRCARRLAMPQRAESDFRQVEAMTAGTALATARRHAGLCHTLPRSRRHDRLSAARCHPRHRRRARPGHVLDRRGAAQGQSAASSRRPGLPAGDARHRRHRDADGGGQVRAGPAGDRDLPRLPRRHHRDRRVGRVARDPRQARCRALHRPGLRGLRVAVAAVGRGRARARHQGRLAAADGLLGDRPVHRPGHAAQAPPPRAPGRATALVAGRALHRDARQRHRHPHRVPRDRPAEAAAGDRRRGAALLAWFGPLVVAVVAKVLVDRRWKPKARRAAGDGDAPRG